MSSPTSGVGQAVTPRDETTYLNYLEWDEAFASQKPYEVLSQVPKGFPKCNFSYKKGPRETIHDIRGQESRFSLDDHAFEVRKHDLNISEFNKQTIEEEYLPSISALLQIVFPDAEILIFDWKLRSTDPSKHRFVPGSVIDLDDPLLHLKPVQAVHVDQSPVGAMRRVRQFMGDRAGELEKKRVRIINIWRPICETVENYPLAVCDGSTVPAESLVPVDHVRKYHVGESFYVLESPDLRWYYLNRQTKDEAILFKMSDTKQDVKAKCCPHTSFVQTGLPQNTRSRESIEVRALVFS